MRKDRIIDKQTGKPRKRYFNEHGGHPFIKKSNEAKEFFNSHPKLVESYKKMVEAKKEALRNNRLLKQN